MRYLIMYDISDDRRRTRVEKLLGEYGDRVNYSVFEIESTKSVFEAIVEKLLEYTSPNDDVRVYMLSKETLRRSFRLHERGYDEKEYYF